MLNSELTLVLFADDTKVNLIVSFELKLLNLILWGQNHSTDNKMKQHPNHVHKKRLTKVEHIKSIHINHSEVGVIIDHTIYFYD